MRSNRSVIPAIAETITTGKSSPVSCTLWVMIFATRRIRSPLPTEVPPNLMICILVSIRKLHTIHFYFRRHGGENRKKEFFGVSLRGGGFACLEGRGP